MHCPLAFFSEVAISQIFPRYYRAKVHILLENQKIALLIKSKNIKALRFIVLRLFNMS